MGLVCAAAPAFAQPAPNAQLRLYYSPYFSGQVDKSPADPDGSYSDEKADDAHKVELEVILYRHFGLSAARIPFHRNFKNKDGDTVDESAEERMYSLTLYATESRKDSWNVFAGTGWGEISRYLIRVNNVREDEAPLHRDLQLRRNFAGFEYTFDRLGVRVEADQIMASRESNGQKAKLEQQFLFLSFYIPFN